MHGAAAKKRTESSTAKRIPIPRCLGGKLVLTHQFLSEYPGYLAMELQRKLRQFKYLLFLFIANSVFTDLGVRA